MKKVLFSLLVITSILSCSKKNDYNFFKVKEYVTIDSIVYASGAEYNVYATVKLPVDSIQVNLLDTSHFGGYSKSVFLYPKKNPIKVVLDTVVKFHYYNYGVSYRGEFYNEGHFFTINK